MEWYHSFRGLYFGDFFIPKKDLFLALSYVHDALLFLFLFYLILQVLCNFSIFTKAGEKGWKSIIPVYKDYIQAKISWSKSVFWFVLVLYVVTYSYVFFLTYCIPDITYELFELFLVIFAVLFITIQVLTIIAWIRLSQAFGKNKAFMVGLVLLNIVFLPILAFGKSEYKGNVYILNRKKK